MSSFILGVIVGGLVALIILFWQQINAVYQNRDILSGANQIYSGITTIGQKL